MTNLCIYHVAEHVAVAVGPYTQTDSSVVFNSHNALYHFNMPARMSIYLHAGMLDFNP